MKHYKKRSLWALAMFILILYACVDEVTWRTTPENNSISVKEAQRYFNEHVQTFYLCGGKQARSADEALLVTPLWEKGKNVLFRNQQMVEVPVYAPMTITKNLNAMQEDSARHVNTLYNLLAEKMEDGNILFTIAKVTCEIDCLKKIRGKRLTFHIGYDNLKEFSGTIRYYSLEGEFLTGFDYRNGRRIAIIESSKPYDPNKESSAKRKATRGGYEYCRTDFIAEDVFYCYDVIIGGEVTKSVCEYDHTDYYEETHCEWIETDDEEKGDISGGGGGNNPEELNTPPCVAATFINQNTVLKDKIMELLKYAERHPSEPEDGWIKLVDGTYLKPIERTHNSLTYDANEYSGKVYSEHIHVHPGEGLPSYPDLMKLGQDYKYGHIQDKNFVYGVLSTKGSILLTIEDGDKFAQFSEKVLTDRASLENIYLRNVTPSEINDRNDYIDDLITFLDENNSGLSVILVETKGEMHGREWVKASPLTIIGDESKTLIHLNCN